MSATYATNAPTRKRPHASKAAATATGWEICHPPLGLGDALPEVVARARSAVVIGEEGDILCVAVAQPDAPGLAPALAAAARRHVRLIAAGRDELALALLTDRAAIGPARRQRLSQLMADLGLDDLLDSPADGERPLHTAWDVDGAGAADTAESVAARLPDGWGPEVLGLLEGLPHVATLGATELHPALRLLLPPSLRAARRDLLLAPWRVEEDTLLLLCAVRPRDDTLAEIAHWTGFGVRCILCEPDVLRQAALHHRVYTSRFGGAHGRIRARAPRTGDPAKAVMGRFAAAVAPRHGARALRPKRGALSALPAGLAVALNVLPVRRGRGSLDVAVVADGTDAEELVTALTLVTGLSVRARMVEAAPLRAALGRAYGIIPPARTSGAPDASPGPPSPRRAAIPIPRAPAARASGPVEERSAGGVDARRASAAANNPAGIDERDGMAIAYGLPSIRLERYAVQPAVAGSLPPDRLRDLCALPLRREGHVLWVALATPDGATLDALADLTKLTIRPVLARRETIMERLATLEAAPDPDVPLPWHDHPVIAYLNARHVAPRQALRDALSDPARPLDQALDDAGILGYQEFAAIVARASGLPRRDLGLQERRELVIDALGRRVERAVWEEIVDPAAAALLPPELIEETAVLPLCHEASSTGEREGGLIVAVGDPFAPRVERALARLAHERVQLVVASRPAILTALARIRGEVRLGERLLTTGIITEAELARGLRLHRTAGVRLGQALVSLNLVSQKQLAHVIAAQHGLPFVSLHGMHPDVHAALLLPEEVERRLGMVPLYDAGATLVVATPDPLNGAMIDEAAARTGRDISLVVCTEADLEATLETLYRADYLRHSTSDLIVRTPEESASRVLSRAQRWVLVLASLVGLLLLWRAPVATGIAATAVCTIFYLAFSLHRCYLIYKALAHDLEISIPDEEVAAVDEAALPIYTILVPLYHEAAVLPTLLQGLARLDYPAGKLDVKLLLEEDDEETLDAVAATQLPSYVHPVVVPAAPPRGKPKACNYGLIRARGEYVVIYDAEDVPEPDQLKKAVLAFRKAPPDVACLQAKLSYYNSDQNLLTRWFTIEYAMWFDLFLPGLDASGVPIPLGGTSNHFPTARLREVGAWDPYNVTEDADLGIRLFRRGWKTAVVDSTTYEEANSELFNWFRQRSRWVKGYIQTFLVHMRHPVQLWRALGPKAFFSFLMVVGGTGFGFLLNPVFWCLTSLWYLSHTGMIRAIYPGPIFYLGAFSLFVGNASFIYLNIAGCLRSGHYDKVKYALISPLYWALMSVAAWKGFLQLWTNPFYWEKTVHGLYNKRPAPRAADRADDRQGQGVA